MSHEPLEPIMWVALGAVGSALLGVVAMFITMFIAMFIASVQYWTGWLKWKPRRKGD